MAAIQGQFNSSMNPTQGPMGAQTLPNGFGQSTVAQPGVFQQPQQPVQLQSGFRQQQQQQQLPPFLQWLQGLQQNNGLSFGQGAGGQQLDFFGRPPGQNALGMLANPGMVPQADGTLRQLNHGEGTPMVPQISPDQQRQNTFTALDQRGQGPPDLRNLRATNIQRLNQGVPLGNHGSQVERALGLIRKARAKRAGSRKNSSTALTNIRLRNGFYDAPGPQPALPEASRPEEDGKRTNR